MKGSVTQAGRVSVADQCRRLAEMLSCDAVGVMSIASGHRRVAWWTAPGSPPLPARLDDVLEDRADGWIVCPLVGGFVFARVTETTASRAPWTLRTVGPGLVAALDGGATESPELDEVLPALGVPAMPEASAGRELIEARLQAERTRWAYEIHDGLTQAVTAAVLELESLRTAMRRNPDAALEVLDAAIAEIRTSLERIRTILFHLSNDPTAGPAESFSWHVEAVAHRWKLPATVTVEGDVDAIPKPVTDAAYVVVAESLANAAKHASPKHVTVEVRADDHEVLVEVRDDGRGFDPMTNGEGQTKHFGLEMMRTRVAEIGGELQIDTSPGDGTRVVARLPVGSQGETR